MNCTDIVGYTHSDGYCLCTLHGTDDRGNELPDAGNESGKVQPIFACEETDTDLICDACFTELHAAGKDVRDAIILEANIGVDEEEEAEDEQSWRFTMYFTGDLENRQDMTDLADRLEKVAKILRGVETQPDIPDFFIDKDE